MKSNWNDNVRNWKEINTITCSCTSRKFFQNFSRSFRKFFASFRKFFEGFGLALTCWDLLGSARMHSDASGCVRMRPDAFGKISENLIRKSVFAIFAAFWRISEKMSSKSASASNFAPDAPILRVVRPEIVKKCLVPGLCQPYRHVWRLVCQLGGGSLRCGLDLTNIKG